MADLNWRRYHQEFDSLADGIIAGSVSEKPGIREVLRTICQHDPAYNQTRLGAESYLIAFLEFLFFKAEGPYSPDFPRYAEVIRSVFSLSEPLIFLLNHNAADAIGNMVLNKRGKLKFLIADHLELRYILYWWPRFGLIPVSEREVFDAVMRKSTIRQRTETRDPGLLIRLYEVFPDFKSEFCPDDFRLEDVISRLPEISPLPSVRRFNRLYTRLMSQGRNLHDLIREEEQRILPIQVKRNTFLAFLVKKLHNNSCQICPFCDPAVLDPMITVHHIIPLSDGGKDIAANMLVICNSHHKAIHQGLIEVSINSMIEVRCQGNIFKLYSTT